MPKRLPPECGCLCPFPLPVLAIFHTRKRKREGTSRENLKKKQKKNEASVDKHGKSRQLFTKNKTTEESNPPQLAACQIFVVVVVENILGHLSGEKVMHVRKKKETAPPPFFPS